MMHFYHDVVLSSEGFLKGSYYFTNHQLSTSCYFMNFSSPARHRPQKSRPPAPLYSSPWDEIFNCTSGAGVSKKIKVSSEYICGGDGNGIQRGHQVASGVVYPSMPPAIAAPTFRKKELRLLKSK
ncbi:hypothetical protein M8J76_017118 [Diaphorina citri]|nr:hypothetical protein M8J76_017118 [Diaphorina citri]